jgi:N-acetylglucosaminyl-diphospho-decaprenol L-rhamnosyltransferase
VTRYDDSLAPDAPDRAARVVSIVVVTYNSAATMPQLVRSLPDALVGVGEHELIVVDSASGDGTLDTIARIAPSARRVSLGSNAGYAAGINAGVAASTLAGPVLVLNPDLSLTPGAIAPLLAKLRGGVGVTVPRLFADDGSTQPSLRRRPTLLRAFGEAILGGRVAGRFAKLGEVVRTRSTYEQDGTFDWATGAAMCMSRACLDSVGSWDESFFLYSEETDFALRAAERGFTLRFVADSRVMHRGGEGNVAPRLFALLTVNRVRLYRKYHGALASSCFWFAVLLHVGVRALAGSAVHGAALRALFRAPSRTAATARGPQAAVSF